MANALNILLVEDEFMTRRLLKKKLIELGHHIVGDTDNTDDAVDILEKESVDLAILDINLGEESKDGIWLGEYIRFHEKIPFVYLTAYETTDIVDRAINTQPHAYLTKPFSDIGLKTTLAIAGQQHENNKAKEEIAHLLVKEDKILKQILLEDVSVIESDGNYLLLRTKANEKFRYRSTIKKILNSLPDELFLQTHRAFVVNKKHVNHFDVNGVQIGKYEAPISKGKRTKVLEVLNALNSG